MGLYLVLQFHKKVKLHPKNVIYYMYPIFGSPIEGGNKSVIPINILLACSFVFIMVIFAITFLAVFASLQTSHTLLLLITSYPNCFIILVTC